MAKRKDPNEIVHVMPRPGKTVLYEGKVYADRATLQVRRHELEEISGPWEEVNPAKVPDVARRGA
jgi:hypothetical protein